MCVCVCVCMCIFCIVTLELLSTLCVSFFKFHLLLLITFSISMYVMCVTLCLFSVLSRRVGALQISIIIIMIFGKDTRRELAYRGS